MLRAAKPTALFRCPRPRRKRSRTMSKISSRSRSAIVRREATPSTHTREEALAIARAALSRISDEEDTAIRPAAMADPDAQGAESWPRRKPGPPPAEVKKVAVSLKLDPDVLTAYR